MSEPNTICAYCNKSIYKRPYELNKRGSKRHFCNKECRNAFQKGSTNDQYTSVCKNY